jgi:hypothetical protein
MIEAEFRYPSVGRHVVVMSFQTNLSAYKPAEMLASRYNDTNDKPLFSRLAPPCYIIEISGSFLAGAGGFEPPYGGIKIRCLTTWLRPNR